MKNISLLFGLVLLVVVFSSNSASAHVIKYDNDIGASLHINPDDDPVSGKPTSFSLRFTDVNQRLKLPECNCEVKLKENDKTIEEQPLQPTDPYNSTNTVTFPKADVYNLIVSGQPKNGASFQPFTLDFPLRVNKGGGPDFQRIPALLWVGISASIGLILLAAFAMEYNEHNH